MAMLASTLLCWWTIQVVFLIQGGQTSDNEEATYYDPWKESDRPKVVVDYHNGPLRGKKQLGPLIRSEFGLDSSLVRHLGFQ